ncbi:hypothetical protein GCM10009784_00020 [Arthrobacter parietis]|uniref:Cell division protein FtsK n=1 Tax=Arthrobacter parietis TaxID=271434 RepID=A0ABN3ALE7_9MICC
MDLHVTLAAGPGVQLPGGEPTEELVITKAHLASGSQLHEQLSERTGAKNLLIEGRPLAELQPGVPPFTSGAVIVAATGAHPSMPPSSPGSLLFLVRSGPDAGKAIPLSRGVYTIGRSAADITIHDPGLSRLHAVLTVTNDALTLRDRQSSNGVWVDGTRAERIPITTDSDIRLGASRCAVVLAHTADAPLLAEDLTEPCGVSAPPPPESSRLLIITAFLPLVLGIVLAVTTGMWFFLAFSALSAATGMVPLITGRKKRRAFANAVTAAVSKDSARRRRAALDAGALTLAALRPQTTPSGAPSTLSTGRRYLRLGMAEQPANVQPKPEPADWHPPVIPDAPVLVPFVEPGGEEPLNLDIRGPQHILPNVARLLILQLSALSEAGEILCFGAAADLPSAARFLPRVTLVADRTRFAHLAASGRHPTVLLFGTGPVTEMKGVRVYRFSTSNCEEMGPWAIDYFPPNPLLTTPDGTVRFQPDFVRSDTFEVLARAIGTRASPQVAGSTEAPVPEAVALPDLIPCGSETIAERWRVPADYGHLTTAIGSSAAGPLTFDLVTEGPHMLIAGTTGSGKSQFLRTLILGLALNHSPADLNFLFIDFKGGSGLGALAALPHVTGMLTDLSAAAVSRALVSLKAEVKRREALFADAGAADYVEYRDRTPTPLPRLIIVIDEFRMLSDEVPGSVHELMRIATLGRSLGMHLVLATQRPQGAITSDIRANITASVALRVQSAMESQDVLESAVASALPVNLPGRGFLRVASGQPIEFQTATTTTPGTDALAPCIMTLASFLASSSDADNSFNRERNQANERLHGTADSLPALVASAINAARNLPLPPLRAPVRAPLPATITHSIAVPPDMLQLGLLDIPEKQEQRPLVWHPAHHSHLALVGSSGSGLARVLSHVSAEHLRTQPDGHLYLLDGDSSLRVVSDAPQIGAWVTSTEVKRATRVLERIAELLADRLNGAPGLAETAPHITVFITGWGRWATAFRSSRFAKAEDALQDIVRDGEAAGITLVISGERELIASRFFSMLTNRLYLPLGASSETLLSWPKLPALDPIPGRAFVQGRISAEADAVAQLLMDSGPVCDVQPAQQPFPVAALPRTVTSAELEPGSRGPRSIRLPVGKGGDNLATVQLEIPPRTAALVVGSSGTGKSQTLDVIEHLAPPSINCLRPGTKEDGATFWKRVTITGAGEDNLLLVDDADLLPRDVHQQLAGLLLSGARAVFASSPSPTVSTSPALAGLRSNPLGIVLGPRSPSDGDAFGLRVDVDGMAPAGRGILVNSNGLMELQIAKCVTGRKPQGPA